MISKINKLAYYLHESISLSIIYYGFHFNKTGSLQLTELYTYFLAVFVFVWLSISNYLFDKNTRSFTSLFIAVVYQYFLSLFTLTLICSVTDFSDISRLFLLQVISGAAALKLVFIVLRRYDRINLWELSLLEKMERPSFSRLVASLSLLTVSFAAVQYFMSGHNNFIYKSHEATLILLVAAWLFSSLLTNKFFPKTGRNIYYKVAPFLKASVLMLFLLGSVFYLLRLESTILKQDLFASALLFSSVESILALLYFNTSKAVSEPELAGKESHFSQSDLPLRPNVNQNNSMTFLGHVRKIKYEDLEDKIYDELSKVLLGHSITIGKFRVLFDRTDNNLRLIEPGSLDCIFNYSPVNDSRVINKSFRSSYKALIDYGCLIGIYTPQENDRRELERRMPRSVFVVYYPLHFVFKRLVPKLPYLSQLYNFVTGGKNRLLSRAELLGRLAYAGFSVKTEIPINGKVLFVANKIMTPAREEFPSFGPIVRLKRIGAGGRTFRVYKFRTMFPYSEFIQKEVFEQNSLDKSGKLKNDFRRNGIGNFLRKLWLDELPQIYNWLKGDLNLVGVRALSEHYYGLYPKDLQELRIQFKPGLVPPYYADMPKTFDEIIDSERNYLLAKQENPLSTDVRYFWKAFVNIVFRGARSG